VYIAVKKKWHQYFFLTFNKSDILLVSPLIFVLCIILFGTKGLNTESFSNLIVMLIMQLFVVAFIEETVFRGIMLRMLVGKGPLSRLGIKSPI